MGWVWDGYGMMGGRCWVGDGGWVLDGKGMGGGKEILLSLSPRFEDFD